MTLRTSLLALFLATSAGCGDSSDFGQSSASGGGGSDASDAAPSTLTMAGNDTPDSGSATDTNSMSALDASTEVSATADAASDTAAEAGPLESIHYYGRWNVLSNMAITVNSGSHITAKLHGTGVSAHFDVSKNTDTLPNLTWQIDGGTWQEAEIASTLSLATGLANGAHDVRLMVRGLNENQSRWTPPLVASVTFLGLEVTGGDLDPSSRPDKTKIEFLGDSITEGVHVHNANEVPKDTPPWRADARLDYACQTALSLDAEWRQVGFGRQGLTIGGNGGVPVAQDAFDFIYAGVPRDSWQADLVVINQGTNDGGATSQAFRPVYATFLQRIRTGYANAQILALRPFNGAHADDIKNEVAARNTGGDAKVFYVDTTGWIDAATDTTDGLHPNPQGHAKVTTKLVAELKKHL
jgi:lysophospholipase L1-like esterase